MDAACMFLASLFATIWFVCTITIQEVHASSLLAEESDPRILTFRAYYVPRTSRVSDAVQ